MLTFIVYQRWETLELYIYKKTNLLPLGVTQGYYNQLDVNTYVLFCRINSMIYSPSFSFILFQVKMILWLYLFALWDVKLGLPYEGKNIELGPEENIWTQIGMKWQGIRENYVSVTSIWTFEDRLSLW
jgi:hypothetical protein